MDYVAIITETGFDPDGSGGSLSATVTSVSDITKTIDKTLENENLSYEHGEGKTTHTDEGAQRLREVRPIAGLGRAHARHQRLQSTPVVAARGAVDVGQGPGLRRDVEDVRLRGEPRARPREAPPPGLGRAPADRVLLALLARAPGLAAAVPTCGEISQ